MLRDGRNPVGMRVQVDKAGRDDQAARVDFARRSRSSCIAGRDQGGDFARGDRNVGGESRRAAAVDNRAVPDDQVVFHSGPIVALIARQGKQVRRAIVEAPALFPAAKAPFHQRKHTIEKRRDAAGRDTTTMDSNFRPRPAEGIEISEVADGFVIYDPKQDRVHYLNQTAAVILELCNGQLTADELAALIQEAYGLPEPPAEEVADCVQRLIEEGLIN
jgi:hypothetical protein